MTRDEQLLINKISKFVGTDLNLDMQYQHAWNPGGDFPRISEHYRLTFKHTRICIHNRVWFLDSKMEGYHIYDRLLYSICHKLYEVNSLIKDSIKVADVNTKLIENQNNLVKELLRD